MSVLDGLNTKLAELQATAAQVATEVSRLEAEAGQLPGVQAELVKSKARVSALEAEIYELVATLPGRHAVKPQETLWSISQKYNTTVAKLKEWNGLASDVLEIAQVLWVTDPSTPDPEPEPEPEPTLRFPGDPGPGKQIVGMATTGGNMPQMLSREKYVGMGLAFRRFNNTGISALALPNGAVTQQIKTDHAANRLPVVSPKPGIEALAAHKFETELVNFFKWTEAQPKYTAIIFHHEFENDWKGDSLAQYVGHAADLRAAQLWVRMCLNKAAGGRPKKTIFMGASMSYSWTPQGKSKFGPPENWNPGMYEGRHVWDMWGADHYEDSYTAPSLDTQKWKDFAAMVTKVGCIPVITELGINNGNKNGGKVLADFQEKLVTVYKAPFYTYFDSHAGPGGKPQANPDDWWDLTEANGTLQAFDKHCDKYGVNINKA